MRIAPTVLANDSLIAIIVRFRPSMKPARDSYNVALQEFDKYQSETKEKHQMTDERRI